MYPIRYVLCISFVPVWAAFEKVRLVSSAFIADLYLDHIANRGDSISRISYPSKAKSKLSWYLVNVSFACGHSTKRNGANAIGRMP